MAKRIDYKTHQTRVRDRFQDREAVDSARLQYLEENDPGTHCATCSNAPSFRCKTLPPFNQGPSYSLPRAFSKQSTTAEHLPITRNVQQGRGSRKN